MALVVEFERTVLKRPKTHPTQVVCQWSVIGEGRATLIQLDTRGSEDREKPGKLSQTLQLDRKGAEQLMQILRKEFGL